MHHQIHQIHNMRFSEAVQVCGDVRPWPYLSDQSLIIPACMQLASQNEESQDSQDQDEQEEEGSDKQQSSEEAKDEEEKGETGAKDSCYEFSLTETTMLEVVMDSMRTCGLALALQALSTLLLGEQGFVCSQSFTLQSLE